MCLYVCAHAHVYITILIIKEVMNMRGSVGGTGRVGRKRSKNDVLQNLLEDLI